MQVAGDAYAVGSPSRLGDLQISLEQGLSLGQPPLVMPQPGQAVEQASGLPPVSSQLLFADAQVPFEKFLGLVELAELVPDPACALPCRVC